MTGSVCVHRVCAHSKGVVEADVGRLMPFEREDLVDKVTGKDLIAWGFAPGPWFAAALASANAALAEGADESTIRSVIERHVPPPVATRSLRLPGSLVHRINILPENDHEVANVEAVERHMVELMRVPTIVAGAVLPDACPAGSAPGTIPVGGVAVAENAIHPGMHSADICCSMAFTNLGSVDPKLVLDTAMRVTHFGGGGRTEANQVWPDTAILQQFLGNRFLAPAQQAAVAHFATQGDGNHFFYVGSLGDDTVVVTHHGSRKPGAMLYKAGMEVARKHTAQVAPEVRSHNAWIDADTRDGEDYWEALQIIRQWTKASHFKIHDIVAAAVGARVRDRFWNEHNFVFRRTDGLFYHGKGATPAWADYAADTNGLTLIPLNMAEPVLIVRGKDADNALGFAPHGAGRNFSRTAHMRTLEGRPAEEVFAEETKGIDARSFCGVVDVSELPSAYKNAASVRKQIEHFGLAEIVDEIRPYGSIMAGDWQQNAPWRRKRNAR